MTGWFHDKSLPLHACLLSRQLLMNCTFILANIINSKLALFSSRFHAKVVLDGSSSFDADSLTICVDRLRTSTPTGPEPP